MDLSARLEAARAGLRALQREMTRRHGLCRIEVELRARPGAVEVAGEVLVDRLRSPVLSTVAAAMPVGWTIEGAMAVVQGGPWYAVPSRLELRASADPNGPVVTVLHPRDGPVELLGAALGSALVRDRCGTAAWTAAALGSGVEAPTLPPLRSRSPEDLARAAGAFLGVPYRLGGTDRDGMDCSGLVQRAAWRGLGLALPRNTGDLFGLGAREGVPPPGPGHLAFVWAQGEASRHVGITTGQTLVHASRSRARVVADPQAQLWADGSTVAHLPFEALLELGDRSAGAANLLAAGVRLGSL